MIKIEERDGNLYDADGVWLGPDTDDQRQEIMRRWTKEIARGIRQIPELGVLEGMKKSELANIALEMGNKGIGEQSKAELIEMITG